MSSYELGAPTGLGGVNVNNNNDDPTNPSTSPSSSSSSAYPNLPPVTSYTTIINGQPQVQAVTNTTEGVPFDPSQANEQSALSRPSVVQPQQQQQYQQQQPYEQSGFVQDRTAVGVPTSYNSTEVPVTTTHTIIEPTNTTNPNPMTAPTTSSSVRFDPPSQSQSPANLQIAETRRDRSSSTATARSSTYSVATTGTDTTDGPNGSDDCVKEKRVKEWNKHFDVESDEAVVCTHGCALVISGVMIHGRMYLTEKNIYFRANIVGIVTKRMIPISSITSICPKNVAGSIPNAIEIFHAPLTASRNCNKTSTSSSGTDANGEGQRSLFTTLPKRDHTMGILVDSWRKQAPEAYERYIQGDTSGELAKFGRSRSASTATTSSARGYESSDSSSSHSTVGGAARSPATAGAGSKSTSDKSGAEQRGGGNTGGDGSTKGPHPATQADTPDLEKQAMHTRLPSEPKKVYELLYHKPEFLRGIWESEGMKDIKVEPWTNGKRTFTYSRPLGGKFGSTKCESEETIISPDGSEEWWGVEGTTRTPGVPAGKSFLTRSKTVFTYAEGGGTLMHATYQVEWTGKSMLKSTINGQAESGQQKWNETLAKNLRSYIKEHPDEFPKTGNDENVDESDEADSAAAKSNSDRVPSTTTGGNGSATKTSSRSSSSTDGEFDPIGWVMEDPLRAAISAVLVTIILLYSWSLIKKLFGRSMVQITKKRLAQLEKYEAMFLKHGHPQGAAGQAPVGKVTTQTIIKKIVQPKTTG